MRGFHRHKTSVLAIHAIVLLILAAGGWHIGGKATIPVDIEETRGSLRCLRVTDPAYTRCIHPGESLISVDWIRVSRVEDVEFVLDGKRVGEYVACTFVGRGEPRAEARRDEC